MPLTLLLGGTRSGKSRLAVELARQSEMGVVVIATAEPRDDEMAERIHRHRAERPAEWDTIEEAMQLEPALGDAMPMATVLIDDLTLWVSNLQAGDTSDVEIEELARSAATFAASRPGLTLVVSNEVGSGIVPDNALARRYAELLGRVNTIWADAAAQTLLVVAGRVLPLVAPEAVTTAGGPPS